MSLFDDLQRAADFFDTAALISGVSAHGASQQALADRLRDAQTRLREEMTSVIQLKRTEETSTDFARRVLERINGGPVKP